MRVLFTNNALVWGGAEKSTLQIIMGLRECGHEAVLACRNILPKAKPAFWCHRRVVDLYSLEKMIDQYAEVLLAFTNAT